MANKTRPAQVPFNVLQGPRLYVPCLTLAQLPHLTSTSGCTYQQGPRLHIQLDYSFHGHEPTGKSRVAVCKPGSLQQPRARACTIAAGAIQIAGSVQAGGLATRDLPPATPRPLPSSAWDAQSRGQPSLPSAAQHSIRARSNLTVCCMSALSWLPCTGHVSALQGWPAAAGLQRALRTHIVIHAARRQARDFVKEMSLARESSPPPRTQGEPYQMKP